MTFCSRTAGSGAGTGRGIREALYRARDYVIPDERGGKWLPFALRYEPGLTVGLTEAVVIDVELPPGTVNGPPIDRH